MRVSAACWERSPKNRQPPTKRQMGLAQVLSPLTSAGASVTVLLRWSRDQEADNWLTEYAA